MQIKTQIGPSVNSAAETSFHFLKNVRRFPNATHHFLSIISFFEISQF